MNATRLALIWRQPAIGYASLLRDTRCLDFAAWHERDPTPVTWNIKCANWIE
jgi:hypothetical protein